MPTTQSFVVVRGQKSHTHKYILIYTRFLYFLEVCRGCVSTTAFFHEFTFDTRRLRLIGTDTNLKPRFPDKMPTNHYTKIYNPRYTTLRNVCTLFHRTSCIRRSTTGHKHSDTTKARSVLCNSVDWWVAFYERNAPNVSAMVSVSHFGYVNIPCL